MTKKKKSPNTKKLTASDASEKTSKSIFVETESRGSSSGMLIMVDPARVRFQHSRIRPIFSGCGRSLVDTLEAIRRQELSPWDLPPIQVIIGPTQGSNSSDANNNDVDDDDDGPWYFSLNNRRLWVLKQCREEGLLLAKNNRIAVRVRKPKSVAEAARYTVDKCALHAKIMQHTNNNNHSDNNNNNALLVGVRDPPSSVVCDGVPTREMWKLSSQEVGDVVVSGEAEEKHCCEPLFGSKRRGQTRNQSASVCRGGINNGRDENSEDEDEDDLVSFPSNRFAALSL